MNVKEYSKKYFFRCNFKWFFVYFNKNQVPIVKIVKVATLYNFFSIKKIKK